MENENIVESAGQSWRVTDRRSFLLKGAAVGAGAIGASRLLADPAPASADGGLTRGDVAILQFLAAAELLEADLWGQYNELAGIRDPEVPGVVGLMIPGTNRALVVVYADGDWEASDALWVTYPEGA